MEHHFSVEIAISYGVDVAIFLQNLAFWTLKNISNKQHYYDGRYWVYNTQEAYTILFPYWSRQNIRTIILKALAKDLIIKGNYNKVNYDRTTWYSLTDFCIGLFPTIQNALLPVDKSKSLGWNQPIEGLESTKCMVRTNQPIPDSKPDIKSFSLREAKSVDKPQSSFPQPKEWQGYAETAAEPAPLVKEFMEKKGIKT